MDDLQELQATQCGPNVRVPEQLIEGFIDQGRPSSEYTAAVQQQAQAEARSLQGKKSALQNLKRGVEALAERDGLLEPTPSSSGGAAPPKRR